MSDDVSIKFGADIASLTSAMSDMASKLEASMKKMESATTHASSKMEGSFKGLESAMGALKGVAIGLTAALSFGKIIEVSSQFEQLEIRLKSVMGSSEAAKESFNWIKQFADTTPLNIKETSDAFMMLKNFGLDPMDGTFRKIADSAAKYGESNETVKRATLALGQAWAKGKLQGEEIMQLVEAGIPVWGMLEKATGKTSAELQNMSQKGELGRESIRKLIDAMGTDAVGASVAKMKSYVGAMSEVESAFQTAINDMRTQGNFDFVTESLQALAKVIPDIADVFRVTFESTVDIIKEFGNTLSMIFGGIGELLDSTFGSSSSSMTAMEVFKNSLKVVSIALISFKAGFLFVIETIKGSLAMVVSYLIGFAKASSAALHGDFSGAISAWKSEADNRISIAKEYQKNMLGIAQKGKSDVDKVFEEKAKVAKVADHAVRPLTSADDPLSAKKKTGGSESDMKIFEAQLTNKKIQTLEKEHREITLKEEIAFWEAKANLHSTKQKDILEIQRKISSLQLQDLREANKQKSVEELLSVKNSEMILSNHREMTKNEQIKYIQQELAMSTTGSKQRIDLLKKEQELRMSIILEQHKSEEALIQMEIDRHRNAELQKVQLEEMSVRTAVDLKKMTRLQELKFIADFEQKKTEIEINAQRARISLAEKDPNSSPEALQRLKDELLVIEQKYQLQKAQMEHDVTIAVHEEKKKSDEQMQSMADTMAQGVQTSFERFLISPFKGGLKDMLKSFGDMILQMAAKAAAAQIMDSLFSKTGSGGGAGGFASTVMGLFGGGFETGGNVTGDKFYQVGERNKPEMFRSGGKQYMIPGDSGEIVPNKDLQGGDSSNTQNINITVNSQSGNPDEIRRSVGQAAREAMGALGSAQRYK